jgi:glycosyltransferase involved in cell wall biosynthesis
MMNALLAFLAENRSDAFILLRNLHTVAAFSDYVRRHDIHHIVAGFMSWPAVISYAVSKVTQRPFGISAHARDIFVESGAVRTKVNAASFVTVCTRQGADEMKHLLPQPLHAKLHVVRHGMEHQMRRSVAGKSENPPNETFTFLAVGRLVPKKGYADLLGAFALVLSLEPQCRLRLIGDGPQRSGLERLAHELGIDQSVEFAGWLAQDRLKNAYRNANALVVPSVIDIEGDRDGVPNVILEAFACGLPVIGTDLAGIQEVIRQKETGLLTPTNNPDKLAEAMLRLFGDRELGGRLAQNAQNLLREQYDPETNARCILSLLTESAHSENVLGKPVCC